MEEAAGAPSSLADWDPKRPRASGRGGEMVMTESPSPLTMLFSRHTRRRTFIAGLGSAAAWPVVARAQQPSIPVIGFLSAASTDRIIKDFIVPFRQGLKESGFVEGQNVSVEYHGAEKQPDQPGRLPAL